VADPRRGCGLTGHPQTIWQISSDDRERNISPSSPCVVDPASSRTGPEGASCPVRDLDGWEVTYLVLGEVEPDAVVDVIDRADRNGHALLAP
jgi:hypothetical protein